MQNHIQQERNEPARERMVKAISNNYLRNRPL